MAYESKLMLSPEEVERLVERGYGFRAQVESVRPGYMSTTVLLGFGDGAYVLKVYRGADRERVEFGVRVNTRLKAAGVPVADAILTRDGAQSLGAGENLFVLWRFVAGEPFTPGNLRQLRAAGALLGRMHAALAGVSDCALDGRRPVREAVVEGLRQTWDEPGVREGLQGTLERFRSCLRRVEAAMRAAEWEALPRCVIHGDYRAQNLLFRGDGVAAVLDLDGARVSERMLDLAYAMAFFQAVIASRPLDLRERQGVLDGYARTSGLTEVERRLLPVCVDLALLRGLTLWMRIAYVEGVNERARGWIQAYLPLLDRGGVF